MTTFRPSASVRLTVRCEEFEDTSTLESLLPTDSNEQSLPDQATAPPASTEANDSDQIARDLERNQEQRRELRAQRDQLSPEVYEERMVQLVYEHQDILGRAREAEEAEDGTAPNSVGAQPPDDLTVIGSIYPKSVLIERNGLAQADQATIEISWADVPLDPRVIRSAHVQVILGAVTPEEWEAGMSGADATREDGSLRSVVNVETAGSTEFLGFVDSWGVEYSDSGDTLKLECRDMSAPMRDRQINSDETIDLTVPIDEGVSAFLNRLGQTTSGIEVVYEGEGDPPTPGNAGPQRRRTRRGRRARRGRASGDKMSAWDHITDVVRSTGMIPIMRGFRLVIIEPRTLYSTTGLTRMVYGRNLENLSFTRSLLGVTVPTIEVRCYDPERGRTLWGRYPVASGQRSNGVLGVDPQPRPGRANRVPPSGATPDESIKIMSVSGVTDPAVLERIARNAFEQLGRQEIDGKFSTKNIWSYDREPDEADLLRIDAGDAVELLMTQVDEDDESTEEEGTRSTVAHLLAMNRARRRDYFIGLGWERPVAERFAALQDATGFQTAFRVRRATLRYSAQNGIGISVDFMNFITVREERSS